MPPTTIDAVIDALQGIVDESIATSSRLGYFAALYKRMTCAIRDGIRGGLFEDAARMERVDVAFAKRYFAAREQFFAGELQGTCWLQAYGAAGDDGYTILQHLLISINPHIMIDLPLAAARTCPGDALPGFERDFGKINDIIFGLMPVVDEEIDQLSPVSATIDHIFGRVKDKAIFGAMQQGRASAWAFAQTLAYAPLATQSILAGHRDREARVIGDLILAPNPVFNLVRHAESADVRENIRVLNGGTGSAASTGAASGSH